VRIHEAEYARDSPPTLVFARWHDRKRDWAKAEWRRYPQHSFLCGKGETTRKKSFEEGTQAFEQLLGTKSVEKAIELQQVYFKNAYEGFVTQATKIGALYADLTKSM
jgi:hypothetical protein